MSTFTPTEEQLSIVHSTEQRIKVQAFAGASKTTTCDLYARHRPNVKITYLAFNKATAEEAKQRFPSNVRCVTTHGLCYSQFGAPYRSKLGNARATAVSRALGIGFVQAGRAIETVNNFLTSADKSLSARHAPISVDSREHGLLIDSSIKLWEFMQDTANHDIHMPHDGYLKLFQLTNPTINSDIVITDEAQDKHKFRGQTRLA